MSDNIELATESDKLNDILLAIDTLGGEMVGDQAKVIAGAQLKETVREHLFELENDPVHHHVSARSLGAQITHFYAEAADKVSDPIITGEDISISIQHQGLAQRFFGGDIAGDPFLTIPARSEAYGHRAREFANLALVIFPDGYQRFTGAVGALVERQATVLRGGKRGASDLAGKLAGKQKGDQLGGEVFYWLVHNVHQEPDPTVLPTDNLVIDPIMARLQSYFERIWDNPSERKAA